MWIRWTLAEAQSAISATEYFVTLCHTGMLAPSSRALGIFPKGELTMRLPPLFLMSALAFAAPLPAQMSLQQSSDQTVVMNADKAGLVEMLSTNAVAAADWPWQIAENQSGEFPWQINRGGDKDWPWQTPTTQRVEISAAQLYWLSPSSQDRSVRGGVYAELRGQASVSNPRIRLSGDFASMYPALGDFIWQGPVTVTPLAGQGYNKQLFDIGCAGGYLIVNRINVGRRTRYSPYVFENMMFWCESGDRLGSSVMFHEP